MRIRCLSAWGAALLLTLGSFTVNAKEVVPMLGGVLIDGYDFGADIGPKGSIAFDEKTGEFIGAYNALKMPQGRRAIFAWVHDTVNQNPSTLVRLVGSKTVQLVKIKAALRLKCRQNSAMEILVATRSLALRLRRPVLSTAKVRRCKYRPSLQEVMYRKS